MFLGVFFKVELVSFLSHDESVINTIIIAQIEIHFEFEYWFFILIKLLLDNICATKIYLYNLKQNTYK